MNFVRVLKRVCPAFLAGRRDSFAMRFGGGGSQRGKAVSSSGIYVKAQCKGKLRSYLEPNSQSLLVA
jgi:hypothetical protein